MTTDRRWLSAAGEPPRHRSRSTRNSSGEPPIEALLYSMLRTPAAEPNEPNEPNEPDEPNEAREPSEDAEPVELSQARVTPDRAILSSPPATPRPFAWIAGVAVVLSLTAMLLWMRRSDVVVPQATAAPEPQPLATSGPTMPTAPPPVPASPEEPPRKVERPAGVSSAPEAPSRPSPRSALPPVNQVVVARDTPALAADQAPRRGAINRVLYEYDQSSQDLAFEQCGVTVVAMRATARCAGTVREEAAEGEIAPGAHRAKWIIQLVESEGRWIIEQVSTTAAR